MMIMMIKLWKQLINIYEWDNFENVTLLTNTLNWLLASEIQQSDAALSQNESSVAGELFEWDNWPSPKKKHYKKKKKKK
jgi:hypothetical protein